MKIKPSTRTAVKSLLLADGVDTDRITAGLHAIEGYEPHEGETKPIAVRQARIAELLDCSRHHVRKLEAEGVLKPRVIAGLKRYPVAQVEKILSGEVEA